MAVNMEYIKKLMGWCPICKNTAQQTKQSCSFANLIPVSGKTGNSPEFRTSNVVFRANATLIFFLFYTGISLLLRYPGDISFFLAGLLLINSCYYFLFLKTLDAAVLVDRFGVHLQAFKLKRLEIPYEEIERVGSYRIEKRSKEMNLLLILGVIFCAFVVYHMTVVKGEWKIPLLLISMLPFILFGDRKQKTRFRDLNTQLYIKTRHKRWYELTPYYSLITDEASAAEIKSSIERHLEGV
ncbi:hypothetical protein MSSIT_3887 [Methanosarcina siciliae T4/M]|uniref:DUF1673 family protein n=1 Tax=Methanosarcina siciliae T4/M TaxID=1434120 RepID=A0A0E3L9P0_9EURY|nr:DUF1673 family protein [Methanosarcina siciliae]AKB30606.1 hypothetical protein MSSIT_3887 [Methanosarcina siciliae T4/M]